MVGQEVPSATPQAVTSLIADTASLSRAAFLEKHRLPVLVALEWNLTPGRSGSSTADRQAVPGDPFVRVPLDAPVWRIRKRQATNPDTFWVGRSQNNDVILSLRDVSKIHAYFTRAGDDWFVTDLESRNGTRLDQDDLRPLATTPIRPGQVVRIGASARFLFLDGAGLWDLLLKLGSGGA